MSSPDTFKSSGADRTELIARCRQIAAALPVPSLPDHFSTNGWYVRPDLVEAALDKRSKLFQMRIDYDDGRTPTHITLSAFHLTVDPRRVRPQIYKMTVSAVAMIRQRMMVIV